MIVHFETVRKRSLDLQIDTTIWSIEEMVKEGAMSLSSSDLNCDFLFLNVDAGTGFFGGRKTQVLSYTSDRFRGEYYAGPVLKTLLHGLVGINNLYRASGFLYHGHSTVT